MRVSHLEPVRRELLGQQVAATVLIAMYPVQALKLDWKLFGCDWSHMWLTLTLILPNPNLNPQPHPNPNPNPNPHPNPNPNPHP